MLATAIVSYFIASFLIGCAWIIAAHLGYSRGYRDAEHHAAMRAEKMRRDEIHAP